MPRLAGIRLLRLPENRSALAACQDLLLELTAGSTSAAPNPLYLHGPPGAGKSHLLQSLADEVAEQGLDLCRRSANDFSIADEQAHARQADLTIVEDLHHLPMHAVPTLIGILDERASAGRPTIVTALHGPARLAHRGKRLPARLTSRLASGLVIGMSPMQKPSRRQLLAALAGEADLRLGDEILDWLAAHLSGGGRQLQGAIRQLQALKAMQTGPLRLADVRAHFGAQQAPTIEGIAEHVCAHYDIAPRRVLSAKRSREVVLPRQVSMYLARKLTTQSLAKIGQCFGGRDHKTVQHACRKVESTLRHDAALSSTVRQLQAELA